MIRNSRHRSSQASASNTTSLVVATTNMYLTLSRKTSGLGALKATRLSLQSQRSVDHRACLWFLQIDTSDPLLWGSAQGRCAADKCQSSAESLVDAWISLGRRLRRGLPWVESDQLALKSLLLSLPHSPLVWQGEDEVFYISTHDS